MADISRAVQTDREARGHNEAAHIARGLFIWEGLYTLRRGPWEGYGRMGAGAYTLGRRIFMGAARSPAEKAAVRATAARIAGFGAFPETVRISATETIKRDALKRMGLRKAVSGFFKTKNPVMQRVLGKLALARVAGGAISALNYYLVASMGFIAWRAFDAYSTRVALTRGLEVGGYFPETRGAITSRQRAIRAISESRLQARSAIGNEAQLLHR